MQKSVANAIDSRQFPQWGKYLEGIGWKVKKIKNTQVFIKKIPFVNRSFIKIQHPLGPLPFKEIDTLAKKHRALSVIIEPHVAGFEEKGYKKNGYKKENVFYAHSATIKIDLSQPKEKLLSSFSENARRNIRKSQMHNLKVKTVQLKTQKDDTAFTLYYQLMRDLIAMKKFYAPGYDEYYKKMRAFKDSSFLVFAYEGNVPIASVWYGYYNDVVVYLQTGITKRGYELLANYLLVWEGMLFAKKLGLSVFDFESVYDTRYPKESKEWIGYSQFKKRFHGELVLYPTTYVKYYNLFLRLIVGFASRLSL